MKRQKLIIISEDAMMYEDLEYLYTKSAYKKMMDEGSGVKRLRTVYPTITYACHSAMISGCYPDRTDVYANEINALEEKPVWKWFRSSLKVKTLIDAAKEKGLTTANVFWPVLAGDKNIDYNVPEYWSQPGDESPIDAFRRAGSSEETIEEIIRPFVPILEGNERKHPQSDDFMYECALAILRKFKPDILLVHPAAIDGVRHKNGVNHEKVTEALDAAAYFLRRVFDTLKSIGEEDNYNIVTMSDHGQMDMKRVAMLNVELIKRGLITLDDKKEISSYKAFVKGVGASALVFVPNDATVEDKRRVYETLLEMKNGDYGFSEVFTRDEIHARERLDGDFEFVLETDGITSFTSEWKKYDVIFRGKSNDDYRSGMATHGYLPDKGGQPTLIAMGKLFKKGVFLDRRPIVDFAPTIAKALGLDLSDADGTPIDEILA